MALNPKALMSWPFRDIEQEIVSRDCMLYALSLGLGYEPYEKQNFAFLYERDLKAFSTFPVVVAPHPEDWLLSPQCGVTRDMVVHGTNRLQLFRPFPAQGRVMCRHRIKAVIDKGVGVGGIIVLERHLFDGVSAEPVAIEESQVFCRADGGFNTVGILPAPYQAVPNSLPDQSIKRKTRVDAALLYRLNGDYNPLHADPEVAHRAGFENPILHGLCTYGVTATVIAQALGAEYLSRYEARFSSPVYPGDELTVDLWREGRNVQFQVRVEARNVVVLDRGFAVLA